MHCEVISSTNKFEALLFPPPPYLGTDQLIIFTRISDRQDCLNFIRIVLLFSDRVSSGPTSSCDCNPQSLSKVTGTCRVLKDALLLLTLML